MEVTEGNESGDPPVAISLPRARGRPRQSREARLEARALHDEVYREVMRRMAISDWSSDSDAAKVAAEFGVDERTVRERASDAARTLRVLADPRDREQLRALSLARLSTVLMQPEDRQPMAVVAAARAIGELAGLTVQKHEVSATPAGWAQMGPEERRRILDDAERAIAEERAKLGGGE